MLLKIFIPLACIILPVLLPINAVGGAGVDPSTHSNNTGLNTLAWGNIKPQNHDRYWAHLVLAVLVIVYVCYLFFGELKNYIKLRQAYLTSPQHRLKASATTVLVTSIPAKWLTLKALDGLYDVFPGGVRNIWINRNFDKLTDKVDKRDDIARILEGAETKLVRNAKKKHLDILKKTSKSKSDSVSQDHGRAQVDGPADSVYPNEGMTANNPHQIQSLRDFMRLPGRAENTLTEERERAKKGTFRLAGDGLARPFDVVAIEVGKIGKLIGRPIKHEGSDDDLEHGIRGGQIDRPQTGTDGSITDDEYRPSSRGPESKSKKAVKEKQEHEYPLAYDAQIPDDDGEPVWKKYLKSSDRSTMRLPMFGWTCMPQLPSWTFIGKKVDTIYYCRKELARLNLEIEHDQKEPESYPLMSSAFIQFNNQIAAHMACQAINHHLPQQMSPRMVEINPDDVVWNNLSVKWWERYLRTFLVSVIVAGMIILWAIPVAFTGGLSQLSQLSGKPGFHWLNGFSKSALAFLQGILPPLVLGLLLALVPLLLPFLAKLQGLVTGNSIKLATQDTYFAFLFVQLFLVVSVSAGVTAIFQDAANSNFNIPQLLAGKLPDAATYFFSYMILQALSVSAGALAQIMPLAIWFLWAPMVDGTPRKTWKRQVDLNVVDWGTFFPVYTVLACIGLIYSVIAPLILIFNVITFGLFWVAYRYNTLYVNKFRFDNGGLLFPKAINQLFVGIYVMELCLIGLFFVVEDQHGKLACKAQAIIMIVVTVFTAGYQIMLNWAFSPLFKYLPITLEDDAVLADEEYARMQQSQRQDHRQQHIDNGDYELTEMQTPSHDGISQRSPNLDVESLKSPAKKSTEIGDFLFKGFADEIDDLTAEERDTLISRAFRHRALRSRRPAIWIPRDDLGVSDDEIKRTQRMTDYIWISNEGTTLDNQARCVFNRSPPDFSELDLIDL